MKLTELRARESLDARLEATLLGCIRMDEALGDSRYDSEAGLGMWYEHPFFSVFVKKGFCEAGRLYLRAQYMYTPVRRRRLAQAAAVGLMSAGPIFDRSLKSGVRLPDGSDPQYQMWMIGNHRVRRFDFARNVVRVYPKAGFSDAGIRKEIAFRKEISRDWACPLTALGENVFEEPLMDAVPFDRVPDEEKRDGALEAAVKAVAELNGIGRRQMSGADYMAERQDRYEKLKARMHDRFAGLDLSLVDEVFSRASSVIMRAMRVDVGMTHGDLQPGNVLVPNGSERGVCLIDWEDVGERASVYDVMTWRLESRRPNGLSERMRVFAASGDVAPFSLPCSADLALALWAVEEWLWLLEANSREGIEHVPQGLVMQFRELRKFLKL